MKNFNSYENTIRALIYLYKSKSYSDLEFDIINHWQNSLPSSVHPVLARIGRLLRNDEFEVAWILVKKHKIDYYHYDKFKICYYSIAYMLGSLLEKNESSKIIMNWDRKTLPIESVKLFDKIRELIASEL